jgi:chaperonin GroEL
MSDYLFFDIEAQQHLRMGVEKLYKAVSSTMGPQGKLVLIERIGKPPHLTKDGATVAKNVKLANPLEGLGASLIRQASEQTAQSAGDGSTTATVLTREFYNRAIQALQTGILSSSEMSNLMKSRIELIVNFLKNHVVNISTNEEIRQIASVSANGDTKISDLIAQAISEVGSAKLVTVQKSKTTQTNLQLVKGVRVERGYVSHYFANSEERNKCTLEEPFVLILNCKLNSLSQIVPVLEKVAGSEKSILVIANDFEDEVIQSMITNVTRGALKICAIKSPFYGENRSQVLQDLADSLGSKVLNELDDKQIKNLNLTDLGLCKSAVISNHETLLVECGRKNTKQVTVDDRHKENIAAVDKLLENEDLSKEEVAFLKQRLVILKGVVAVLSIGAYTESELLETFDRVDDALHATKAAMDGGFLPGGGLALARAGMYLTNLATDDLKEKTVNKIIADSCFAPMKQILKNADLSVDFITETVKSHPTFFWGYNIRTAQYCDLIEAGIIDPLPVAISALNNAVSAASSLINIGCVILDNEQNYQPDVQMVHLDEKME